MTIKLKIYDYSNRFSKSINSQCPYIFQIKIFTNLTNYKTYGSVRQFRKTLS